MDADLVEEDLGYVELGLDGGWCGVAELAELCLNGVEGGEYGDGPCFLTLSGIEARSCPICSWKLLIIMDRGRLVLRKASVMEMDCESCWVRMRYAINSSVGYSIFSSMTRQHDSR